jgi:HEPN domain-containing protein
MRPEALAEARAWFHKAANDLRGAEIDLAASPPLLEDAVFHCQQAAEKAMKGFLSAHDRPFKKTHDLDELGRACESLNSSLAPLLAPARDLTVFAWEYRYPGSSDVPTVAETRQALDTAQSVYDALLGRLPPDATPTFPHS